MEADKIGKELKTSKNKARRKARLDKQLETAKKSRKTLIEQLEKHNVKLPDYICFSRTKMRIALAEVRKFPQSRPGILVLSWKRFFKKSNLIQVAKDVLGVKRLREIYLLHVGKKYREPNP